MFILIKEGNKEKTKKYFLSLIPLYSAGHIFIWLDIYLPLAIMIDFFLLHFQL